MYQAGRRYTFAFLSLLKKATVVAETSRTIYFLASVNFFDSFYQNFWYAWLHTEYCLYLLL